MTVQLRACPACYRVVPKLIGIRVTLGLELRDPAFRCEICVREWDELAAADPAVIIERTGRILE